MTREFGVVLLDAFEGQYRVGAIELSWKNWAGLCHSEEQDMVCLGCSQPSPSKVCMSSFGPHSATFCIQVGCQLDSVGFCKSNWWVGFPV